MQVTCASPLAVGSFVWQPRAGAFALTLVCKATYVLQQGVSPLAETPDEPSFADIHWQGNPTASVHVPSDLVPFKRRIDVLVCGHVHAPPGAPVRSLVARLGVGPIQKSVAVLGDRYWGPDGRIVGPAPFTTMPLLWERAEGGRRTWNPVGLPVGQPKRRDLPVPLPSFEPVGLVRQEPAHQSMPVGLGALSPSWPTRTMHLRHHAATWSHDSWYRAPLPEDVDPAYFNSAPPDQQIDRLPDWIPIYLEHLHPEVPNLGTVIEEPRPRALVARASAAPFEIWLRCDTVLIDADRGTCTLTWRASVPLADPFEEGIVHVTMTRGSHAEATSGEEPLVDEPTVDRLAEEPEEEEAPATTARPHRIEEEEETTSMAARGGLVLGRGLLLMRYASPEAAPAPPEPAAPARGDMAYPGVEELSAEEVLAEELSAEELSAEEVLAEELSAEELSAEDGELAEELDFDDEETRTGLPVEVTVDNLYSVPAPGRPAVSGGDGSSLRIPAEPTIDEPAPARPHALPFPSMGAAFPASGAAPPSQGPAFQSPGLPPPPARARPPTLQLPPSAGSSRPKTLPFPRGERPARPATLPFPREGAPSGAAALPFQWGGPASLPSAPSPGTARRPPAPLPSPIHETTTDDDATRTLQPTLVPSAPPLPFQPASPSAAPPAVSGSFPAASGSFPGSPSAPPPAVSGSFPAAARAPEGPRGARPSTFDDDVTFTGPVEAAPGPLPFQAGTPPQAPGSAGPPPVAPLFALGSAEVTARPAAPTVGQAVAEAGAQDVSEPPRAPERPEENSITPERYARIKSELWGADERLPEVLARHGIDEIAWRVHERRQADALAAEAREGRCDLALAMMAAFEAAQAALKEAEAAPAP